MNHFLYTKIEIQVYENYRMKLLTYLVSNDNKTEHAVQSYTAGNEVLSLLKHYELMIKSKQQH